MKIVGIQKLTLLDYPGKMACTVFLGGCNFRCPFCHNSQLLAGADPIMDEDALISLLEKRKGILEGVCITGGEPTLYEGLPELLGRIKGLGYQIKLDTNGYRPEMLRKVVRQGLVDYVAMDAKNAPGAYAKTAGLQDLDLTAIEESLRFLIGGDVDYELRTTLVAQLHDKAAIADMGQWLASLVPGKKPGKLFLQSFVDRDTVLFSGLSAPEAAAIETFAKILEPFVEQVCIRNS